MNPPCPHCKKPILSAQNDTPRPSWAPFCSERCKMADLGKWLGGAYAIPGAPVDPADFPASDDDPR